MACKVKVSPGSESGAGLGTFLVRSPERNDGRQTVVKFQWRPTVSMFCTSNINPASKIISMQVAATRATVTNLSNSPKATNPTRRSRTVSQKMLIFLQDKCEKSAHRKPLAE